MRHADALISNLCILNPFYPSEPHGYGSSDTIFTYIFYRCCLPPFRVLNELTLGEKRDVLEKLRTGKMSINIRINEAQILSQLDGSLSKSRCRRMRKTVNAEKFQFFVRCRAKLIPISGQLLQTNAIDIARKMGIKQ
ncbi:hypothetical protein T07_6011 [Trichinella nelsoni]|uniref:Uncharacterized protein n=1 Tax=Trichinella nelsoni TaxID=6336 RepID=A0A0V0RX09_9BILA|nr:hypothetical protein T07_6011 [Trichinella nelsoni]